MTPTTALLLIDTQVNMFDPANPAHEADAPLACLADLLVRARAATPPVPVIFVRNCGGAGDPDQRGAPGREIHPRLAPGGGDLVLDTTTSDTFASTALADELAARGIQALVIAGPQSEHCVRATVLGALARGLHVTLVANGHSTYDGGGRTAAAIRDAVNAEFARRVEIVRAGEP